MIGTATGPRVEGNISHPDPVDALVASFRFSYNADHQPVNPGHWGPPNSFGPPFELAFNLSIGDQTWAGTGGFLGAFDSLYFELTRYAGTSWTEFSGGPHSHLDTLFLSFGVPYNATQLPTKPAEFPSDSATFSLASAETFGSPAWHITGNLMFVSDPTLTPDSTSTIGFLALGLLTLVAVKYRRDD